MGSSTERGTWTGKLDFLLSCLGYAVGLGNVWRFPYLCYKNGGGAFLVPYAIMLFTVGIPIFLLELAIGQYSAKAPITLFKHLSPIFKGLGYCMFVTGCVVGIYYNMIIGWTIYYLFASFTGELPWSHCDKSFATDRCFSDIDFVECKKENGSIYTDGTCFNATYATLQSLTDITKNTSISASEEFFNRMALGIGPDTSLGNLGEVQWGLALSSLASWAIICACLIKGIKSSGKVVYFTATFPYLILTILLIKGVTLPGAAEGIRFYLVPDWNKVADPNVWKDAAVQIFFSLSIASGGLITLASYNKFDNNVVRDTLVVCFGNCLTSVYAGFAIFSILGYMAHTAGVEVSKVVDSGSGLAFIAYPTAILTMWCPPLWAILFFLMLLTLGLDTMFATVENVTSSLIDEYPKLNKHKSWVVVATCVAGFFLGLPLCCQGGRYLLDLLDSYAAGLPFLFTGLCECIIVAYCYGISSFFDDIAQMLKKPLHWFAEYHVGVLLLTISPLIIIVLMVLSVVEAFVKPASSGEYKFPAWGHGLGWGFAIVPIAIVPVVAIATCLRSERRWPPSVAWKALTGPTTAWRDNQLDFTRESIHAVGTEASNLSMLDAYSLAAPHPYPYASGGEDSRLAGKNSRTHGTFRPGGVANAGFEMVDVGKLIDDAVVQHHSYDKRPSGNNGGKQ